MYAGQRDCFSVILVMTVFLGHTETAAMGINGNLAGIFSLRYARCLLAVDLDLCFLFLVSPCTTVFRRRNARNAFPLIHVPPPRFASPGFQEGYQHLVRSGLVGGKAVLLGWNGEDTDGFLAVRIVRQAVVISTSMFRCATSPQHQRRHCIADLWGCTQLSVWGVARRSQR